MTTIYGVDTTQSVTAPMVRDAIIRCFCLAHADHAELDDTNPNFTEQYCATIVRKAFQETGGDFDHPTRQSLENTLPWLASFSKTFRDPEVISHHMKEIQTLIERL